jgi:hypothetical protein
VNVPAVVHCVQAQQSDCCPHCWPALAQVDPLSLAPHAPAVAPSGMRHARPEQQVEDVVQAPPDGWHVGGASQVREVAEQIPEQQAAPAEHPAPFCRQVGALSVVHTPVPLSRATQLPSQQLADPTVQVSPFGVQLTAVQWFFPSLPGRQGA